MSVLNIRGGPEWRRDVDERLDALIQEHDRLERVAHRCISQLNEVAGDLQQRVQALEQEPES